MLLRIYPNGFFTVYNVRQTLHPLSVSNADPSHELVAGIFDPEDLWTFRLDIARVDVGLMKNHSVPEDPALSTVCSPEWPTFWATFTV